MVKNKFGISLIFLFSLLCIMLISQSAIAAAKSSVSGNMVIRFNNPTEEIVKEFRSPQYDFAAYRPGKYLDIVVSADEYRKISSRGFNITITQTDEQISRNLKIKSRGALEGYRDYEMLIAELQDIAAANPEICKLYDIGDTWGKIYAEDGNANYNDFQHDIWAIKVSDNVATEEDEPSIYYLGEHHAREPITLEMVMTVLKHVVDNYGKDNNITQRVNDSQIWFVPLVNPNGHKIITDMVDNWWRKNIRDNNESGEFEVVDQGGGGPDGVDLNRNYGFGWGPIGTSNDPNDSIYHGPEPWSEPEIQAVKSLLDSHHFLAGITYHTYGELVLYPYGNDYDAIGPDNDALERLAVDMAEAITGFVDENGTTEFPHGHYDPGPGWGLYPTNGDTNDYSYGVHGTFSYTIEMAREFIPSADVIDRITNDNLPAALILLNRPWKSTLTGHITDAVTGKPIVAEVFVHGIDDTMEGVDDRYENAPNFRHPYRSNEEFGTYYRMLENGSYQVTFRAPGYSSLTKTVQINSDGQTIHDIQLEKSACPLNNLTCEAPLSGIEGGSVFIPLSGTNVAEWSISYNGLTTNAPGTKTMFRLMDLKAGENDVMVTAKGFDPDGNQCEDTIICTVTAQEPAECPVNSFDPANLPQVEIGGSVILPLVGTNVDTWSIIYNEKTIVLPGSLSEFEFTNLLGGTDEISVVAAGFDSEGQPCENSVSFSLNYKMPTSGITLDPLGPFNPGDKVLVQVSTTNAVSVRLSDGVSIENAEMMPMYSPLIPDYNNIWNFFNNTWTFEYTVFTPTSLTVDIVNPNGESTTESVQIDVNTTVKTVSGIVKDTNTGWPLYAEVIYGLGSTWTDPLTGMYSVEMPSSDYDFTVKAWLPGYQVETRTVSAAETTADFVLDSDNTCYAPGYSVNAVFYEPFNDCSMPAGWTVNDNSGGEAVWFFDNPATRANLTGGSGCFAISDSDFAGEVAIDTELITPAIDCSALTRVSLSFNYDFRTYSGSDMFDLDISVDDGTTWTNLEQFAGSSAEVRDPQTALVDISTQAAGQSSVKIRFRHYDAFNEYWFQLDDIKVFDPSLTPCTPPTSGGLVFGNVSRSDTEIFLNASSISDDTGNMAHTVPVPGDDKINDGFYALFTSSGSQNITADADGHEPQTQTVVVPDLGAVMQNFQLTMTPLDEMLEATGLTWVTSGDGEWFGQTDISSDSVDAAQGGDIGDYETTTLSTIVTGPGKLTFSWKVSSEENWDYLRFYIGDDMIKEMSGEVDWTQETIAIPEGEHELIWAFEKDSSVSEGMDTGWVDAVTYDNTIPIAPEAVTAAGIVDLTWAAVNAPGLAGYNLYRNGTKVNDSPLTETEYTDTDAQLWEMSCYSISAVYADSESEQSGETCLMPHEPVIYVNAAANGANNGSSWTDAFTRLQSALDIALPGDEIWVAQGTYTPETDLEDKRAATFTLMVEIAIYGGFSGVETSIEERDVEANPTILSGDIGIKDDETDNCYHVVTGSNTDNTAVLDGFTITGGYAVDVSWLNRNGAGMFIKNGSPKLKNIVFVGNYADYQGGAIYNEDSSPFLYNVIFMGNTSVYGGGMFNFRSSPYLTNVVFTGNNGKHGGAIKNLMDCRPIIINTTFSENVAELGGAIFNEDNCNPVVENSIMWGNIGSLGGSQIYDAAESRFISVTSEIDISYSIVQGGWDGTGIQNVDPMFVDPANGNFSLPPKSPAIGSGKNGANLGGVIVYINLTGDSDGDGIISIFDALIIAEFSAGMKSQGDMKGFEKADVDYDGFVTIFDALKIAQYVAGLISAFEMNQENLTALDHVEYLSETIGIRTAGSAEEIMARDYIISEFERIGYSVIIQPFSYEDRDGNTHDSFNVSAQKAGASNMQVFVGAHYDSVGVGNGASDNASGIGVMLTVAERLINLEVPYSVTFAAFGAEEVGLKGAEYYVSQMSDQEIADTICMINLDTLMGGDMIYAYGNSGDMGWVRDHALNIAASLDIPLMTNPGLNPDYPIGTTGDWSDHVPFKYAGIPYLYLESTNWEIGDLDGYVQTVDHGEIWHTENDTLQFFDTEYPGRIEDQLFSFTEVLTDLLLTISPPETASRAKRYIPEPYKILTRQGIERN